MNFSLRARGCINKQTNRLESEETKEPAVEPEYGGNSRPPGGHWWKAGKIYRHFRDQAGLIPRGVGDDFELLGLQSTEDQCHKACSFVCLFVFRQCHRNSLGRPGWPQISRGWLALSSAGTRGVLPMLCSAYCSFLRLGFVVSPGCPETPGLKPSSCFTLPRSRDNRHVSTVPQLAGEYHCAPAGRHVPPCPSGLKV